MAYYCSKCGQREESLMPFCPSCGTKMQAPDSIGAASKDILPANTPMGGGYAPSYQQSARSPLRGFMTFGLAASGRLTLAGVVLALTIIGATLGLPMALIGLMGLIGFGIGRAVLS